MSNQLKRLLMEYGCHDIDSVREIVVPDCVLSFAQIRDSLYLLGNILYEDQENSVYVAKVRSGFCNMNAAVVAMQLSGTHFEALAYAKEGRIFQGISEIALERVSDAVRGKPVISSKPKWMFSSLIALIIIVGVLSIGRNSFFMEKPQIGSQISNGHNDLGSITGEQDASDSQGEILSEEEIAFRTEVDLTLEATKAYNHAVETFNHNVTEYNEVVNISVLKIEEESASFILPFVEDIYQDIYTNYYGENHLSMEMWDRIINRLKKAKQLILHDTFSSNLDPYVNRFNLFVLAHSNADYKMVRNNERLFLFEHRYDVAYLYDVFIRWSKAQLDHYRWSGERMFNIKGP